MIVEPGPFHGVHGLAFGPDGALYAGDIMGSTIHRVDIETGEHKPFVPSPYGMADDLGFAPKGTEFAGTLVWTAVALGKLYAKDPDGEPRLISDDLPSINTVGYAPDGRLYVTQSGGRNNTLWQVDLSEVFPLTKVWQNTEGLNGFTISEDGYLYGPQADLGRVIRFNLETKEIKVIADGFQWPTAVEMDTKGQLYVLDFDGGTVTRVNKETGEKVQMAAMESGLDNMAIGPVGSPYADKLYISSIGGNAIYEIDTITNAFRTVASGHLTAPGGIAVKESDAGKHAYIADMFSLRKVNLETGEVNALSFVSGSSAYPTTVALGQYNDKDVIIIASWFTGRVQVIDPSDGRILRDEKGFQLPHGVAMLGDGSIIVVEAAPKTITRISANGERFPIAGTFFARPTGVAVSENDDVLYVTDSVAGSVSSVKISTGAINVVNDDFERPEGIAILPNGSLVVVDSSTKSIFQLNPLTGQKIEIIGGLRIGLEVMEPQLNSWIFNGIAVGEDGTLYLPSDTEASLLAFTPNNSPAALSLGAPAK